MTSNQPSALILIADGTEEIEFVTPYDVLTRAGFAVKSCGVQLKEVFYATCSRNVRIVPDIPAPHSIPDRFLDECSILILPGGGPGAATFSKDDSVLRLIREFRNEKKHVAFICAGTTALVASTESAFAGEVKDAAAQKCRVTSHPSVKQQIVDKGWEYAADEERVVVDGKVITSRGPGTAILFALTIVEELCGKGRRDEVQGPMVCADKL